VVAASYALAQRGKVYVWGDKGPNSYDCSGLVYQSWIQAGVDIGVSTYDQARAGVSISCDLADLAGAATTCWQAGDLLFARYTGGQHVAMYIGAGLFADAYNSATGVIVHDISGDSWYQAHYWQSRRIVSCDGAEVDPGAADGTISTPALEDIPDLLGVVFFSVPQCGQCNSDGSTLLPPTEWDGEWPSGPGLLNLFDVFSSVISWLAWRISELLRILICWLLSMLAMLAAFLATIGNLIVAGINGLWKMLIFLWLSFQAWFIGLYYLLVDIWAAVISLAGQLGPFLAVVLLIIGFFGQLVADVFGLLGLVIGSIIGLLGWIGGIALGMMQSIIIALSGTTIPTQLSDTHIVYLMVRGGLEAWRDSAAGWILYVLWALCYVWFVMWLSRFVSSASNVGE
jgi:hypothetical protein